MNRIMVLIEEREFFWWCGCLCGGQKMFYKRVIPYFLEADAFADFKN
jgi:hypothetical protein